MWVAIKKGDKKMKVKFNQNGYRGSSMSDRAYHAYQNGEKPKSKWSKSAIIKAAIDLDFDEIIINKLKTLTLNDLKALCLDSKSWHHTSKFANETRFYYVSYYRITNFIHLYPQKIIKLNDLFNR